MDGERGHEQVGGPVMDLPDQQPAADVEADPQRRLVRLAHLDAVELHVRAVVGHLGHRRHEEERQERPGQQQDDEGIQRDLAEQERPVVGVHLAQQVGADPARPAEPVIQPPGGARQRLWHVGVGVAVNGWPAHCLPLSLAHPRSQKLGPTGSVKSLLATR